jgi:hypothetical protein
MGRWDGGIWNPAVPRPKGVEIPALQEAVLATERAIDLINETYAENGLRPLAEVAQANNFSGIVSNVLSNRVSLVTPFGTGSDRKGPDLASRKDGSTLEIKTTIDLNKGGEGHNGHGGWHLVGCYELGTDGGIRFVHVMLAELNAWNGTPDDWASVRETTHADGHGTGHSGTYSTTLKGTAKLRDGSLYRDPAVITPKKIAAWAKVRSRVTDHPTPEWSPFYVPLVSARALSRDESSSGS